MSVRASLGPVPRTGVVDDVRPIVLLDDIPEPRLSVESFKVQGSLDLRDATIRMDEPIVPTGVPWAWWNSQVTIAIPIRLNDDDVSWPILMRGELKQIESTEAPGRHDRAFELSDLWGQSLSQPMGSTPQLNPAGSLISQTDGALMVGREGNRSPGLHSVNGKQTYVIDHGSGFRWTVGTVLEYLSASSGLDLLLNGIPQDFANHELDNQVDLSKTLDGLLESLLASYGLVIQREITRQAGTIQETRFVRPVRSGRPVRIAWADKDQPLSDGLKISVERPAQPAQLWTARADGWLIESTFELVGGWDPALEGQIDDEYEEDLSSDFKVYADVYRNWVLNEDGLYTSSPYGRGPTFDLSSFFDESGIDPQVLAFQPNLTLDDTASPLPPVVEMSTDSGANWSVYPKSSMILNDRAGVYLNSKSLPVTFLSAAKSGAARLRVTASLRNPLPVEVSRWNGNAHTAVLPPRVFDVSKTHLFQRVDVNSIHYQDVAAETLIADEVDDRHKMLGWLIKRLSVGDDVGRATLDLAGAWPLLRVGDCLKEIRGPGMAADGRSQAMTERGAAIVGFETFFTMRQGTGSVTRIELEF